jgi:hypothetical protein
MSTNAFFTLLSTIIPAGPRATESYVNFNPSDPGN